jgi:hypothetical protein
MTSTRTCGHVGAGLWPRPALAPARAGRAHPGRARQGAASRQPRADGRLSASYYHEELVRYPFVDYVLRGDSTEEPVRHLLRALRESTPLGRVENLTWKRADRSVVVNPLTYVPADRDDIETAAYQYCYGRCSSTTAFAI